MVQIPSELLVACSLLLLTHHYESYFQESQCLQNSEAHYLITYLKSFQCSPPPLQVLLDLVKPGLV